MKPVNNNYLRSHEHFNLIQIYNYFYVFSVSRNTYKLAEIVYLFNKWVA